MRHLADENEDTGFRGRKQKKKKETRVVAQAVDLFMDQLIFQTNVTGIIVNHRRVQRSQSIGLPVKATVTQLQQVVRS
jgi:hypothetical protein